MLAVRGDYSFGTDAIAQGNRARLTDPGSVGSIRASRRHSASFTMLSARKHTRYAVASSRASQNSRKSSGRDDSMARGSLCASPSNRNTGNGERLVREREDGAQPNDVVIGTK